MKRSTASWTTAIAASALLAMPVGTWAQTGTTPSQTTSRPSAAQPDRPAAGNQHLQEAEAALNDIPAATLTGSAKSKVAELKRHISNLGKSASPATGKSAGKWSTDVAAADRIITELMGAQGTTGAKDPSATGTSGSAGSAKTSVTLDETAKAKLQEVRTNLTAFAASMSGGGSTPGATPSADDPSSSASASRAAASPTSQDAAAASTPSASASSTSTPSASAASSPSASASPASATPTDPSTSAASAASTSSQASATQSQPPTTSPSSPQSSSPADSAQSVDADAVKRHLTAARDSLSQLTQLPQAAQLTGDARTQVSQLISNFNELITTNTEWRASFAKVQANVSALVGDQPTDPAATAPPAATPGAVGTSGTNALDPAIRAKLVEFRAHLTEFEKAAGGTPTTASASPAASGSTSPSAPASSSSSATTTSATTTSPSASAATPAEPAPAATPEPTPTGTSGSTSAPSATAGTSGTTTPSAASSSPAASASSSSAAVTPDRQTPAAKADAHQGHNAEAMRHIEAIESILNGSGATGTSGSTAAKSAKSPNSLDAAQIEKIRTHLSELRKAINK